MSPPRPEINATIRLCSRTLTAAQSVAVQAANREPFILTHPRSKKPIQNWADDLELEILVALNINPNLYNVRLHEETPSHRPCFELEEVRFLNYIDLSEMEHPLVDGTFEVHFMLKDSVSPPTLVELKQWQNRWRAIAVDPPPRPYETIFSFCASRGSVKKIDVTSLARPPKGDVETTLRHELGLLSVSDLVSSNLAAAMDVDMEHHRLTFHFATESCAERRGVEELDARDLEPGDAVKLHVERQL